MTSESIARDLFSNPRLTPSELMERLRSPDARIEHKPGLYAIFLSDSSALPSPFREEYEQRAQSVIYIGKATDSVYKRLLQEDLQHRRAASFFRSLGAVLGYRPPLGSLRNKKNQSNYRFSDEDTSEIRKWIDRHITVSYIYVESNEIPIAETWLICEHAPLMNIQSSRNKFTPLKTARCECVQSARTAPD